METIIGLGCAGVNIVKNLSSYSQYKCYYVDSEDPKVEPWLKLAKRKSHEGYEKHFPVKKTVEFFKGAKGSILLILAGSGLVTGATLRLLESLKGKKVSVLYIRPDLSLLSETAAMQERVVFRVLQEYARSSTIERMYLVDNNKLDEILGHVSLVGYYAQLNELLVATIHMLNVYNNTKSNIDTFSEPHEVSRLSTFGLVDCEIGEEKMFFDLDFPREKVYYYAINEEKLEKDGALFKRIKDQVRGKKSEDTKVSYGVFSTSYEHDYGYCVTHSSFIQGQELSQELS